MGLGLAQISVTLSASEGSAFSAVFCIAQPEAPQILRRSARHQNDTMRDRAGVEVNGLLCAILPHRGMFRWGCSCTVLGLCCRGTISQNPSAQPPLRGSEPPTNAPDSE
jgi:hypothetical protein